jgi:hypothetical protein
MYRKKNNGHLLVAEFQLPYKGKLDPGNRWIRLEQLVA